MKEDLNSQAAPESPTESEIQPVIDAVSVDSSSQSKGANPLSIAIDSAKEPPPPPSTENGGGSGTPPVPPETFIPDQLLTARLKAHDFVLEHLKQIITMASAVLALTVTFLKDIVGTKGAQLRLSWFLPLCWILLGLSVCTAVYALAVHVNNLDYPNPKKTFGLLRRGCQ